MFHRVPRIPLALPLALVALGLWALVGVLPPLPVAAQAPRGQPILCTVINSALTALTAFTTTATCPQATPGQAMYITDISASSSAISTATTDQYLSVKYGTGTNCGTGTTSVWAGYTLTFTTIPVDFNTPIRVPANNDLCWMHAATGSKHFIVTGYVGP
jgi:ABC-type transport system involved in cytochrome c biogenesis permease subunit